MNWYRCVFSMCFVAGLVLGRGVFAEEQSTQIKTEQGSEGASYEELKTQHEESYKKAEDLREDGEYDAAFDIMRRLADESPDVRYKIACIDVILDQTKALKDANNPMWRIKAKEAKSRIELLKGFAAGNAYYFLVWSRYSWIVGARRDKHIYGALEKAFSYKPNYLEAFILKGDIYLDLARNAARADQPQDKRSFSDTARASYDAALANPEITDKKKAYVLLRLGELEDHILGNKAAAKADWEKAISAAPGSRAGEQAKKLLNQ